MKKLVLFFILLCPAHLFAQVAVTAGLTSSANLGENYFSSAFKNSITLGGERLRFENNFTYDSSNKLESGAGWILKNGTSVILFLSENWFLETGVEYRYRDGGYWVKQVLYPKVGLGFEKRRKVIEILHLSGSIRKETWSINSINQILAFDFVVRNDYLPAGKKLGVRLEWTPGIIRFTQSGERRTGFLSSAFFGFVYKRA